LHTGRYRWLAAIVLFGACVPAFAQADPPARVAYLSSIEGPARINSGEYGNWAEAALNWPVTTGSALQLDPGARIELDGGTLALRLQGPADLDTTRLDDTTAQWSVTRGSASLRLYQLQADERVEIDTPQLALVATQAGDYRVDVDPHSDTTQVTVRAGTVTVYGASGQSLSFGQGRRMVFTGQELRLLTHSSADPLDAFDRWASARDQQREQSASARYLPPDMPGYPVLDTHGQWAQDATWGTVWYPAITIANWAPYRHGRWAWIEPWGWTWIDAAPWGFAPFHYGRWIQIGIRWAWVPQPTTRRPIYAPALVQFSAGGTAWFPLAPGEDWLPPYRVSPQYRERLNDWGRRPYPRPSAGSALHFQQRPGAISVAPHGLLAPDRAGGSPRFGDARQQPRNWVQANRITAPPPRPERGTSSRPRPTPGPQTQRPNHAPESSPRAQSSDARASTPSNGERQRERTLPPAPAAGAETHSPAPARLAPRTRPSSTTPAQPTPRMPSGRTPPPSGAAVIDTPAPSATRAKRRLEEPRLREPQGAPSAPHERQRRARSGANDDPSQPPSGPARRRAAGP